MKRAVPPTRSALRLALEIAEVAFEIGVAHQTNRGADTDLIDRCCR